MGLGFIGKDLVWVGASGFKEVRASAAVASRRGGLGWLQIIYTKATQRHESSNK